MKKRLETKKFQAFFSALNILFYEGKTFITNIASAEEKCLGRTALTDGAAFHFAVGRCQKSTHEFSRSFVLDFIQMSSLIDFSILRPKGDINQKMGTCNKLHENVTNAGKNP